MADRLMWEIGFHRMPPMNTRGISDYDDRQATMGGSTRTPMIAGDLGHVGLTIASSMPSRLESPLAEESIRRRARGRSTQQSCPYQQSIGASLC